MNNELLTFTVSI